MAFGFGSYQIAKSGLYVNEQALNITGHNITNMNTPGYVRQQVIIKDAPYQSSLYDRGNLQQIGLGADLQQIRQIRNDFLDDIYRNENTDLGYWEARQKSVQEVEAILADPMGKGLQWAMNQFWDSWQELAKEPESLTVKAIVRQRGEALVNTINHISSQFDKLRSDLGEEINTRINEVNKITSQIAELNIDIFKYEAAGGTANDYRDQRNLLADRLTKLINADITENQEGLMFITIEGHAIVNRSKSVNLYVDMDKEPGKKLSYTPKIEGSEISVPIKGGLIGGLIDSVKEVDDVKNLLNELIGTMTEEVNRLHKSGKTMGNPPKDGEDFFTSLKIGSDGGNIGLGNIKLNDNLKDPNNIVASKSGYSGDNTIALDIANLRHAALIADNTGILNMDEYYRTIILKVGQSGNKAAEISENQRKLVQAADMNRQTLSGVSLDEEMTFMMKYKFAYDASSRAFNAIDDMIDTLINRMGIVGR